MLLASALGARLRVLATDPVFLCGLCNGCRIQLLDPTRIDWPSPLKTVSLPAEWATRGFEGDASKLAAPCL
jgi:hypothetical protein